MSYQLFCLLADSVTIPDRNTIWHYQQCLGVEGLTALFQAVDGLLQRQGFMARSGQIIDATQVSASIQYYIKEQKGQLAQGKTPEDWSEAKRRQKALHATHTKKHGKRYHGYKFSISVDGRHKFIRKIVTGTASEHDSTHFDAVLDERNTSRDVYADKGYPSAQRSEMLGALGYREHIQRKAKSGKPLSTRQQKRNTRIGKTRARVEHPFAQMRHMGGKFFRTIGRPWASSLSRSLAFGCKCAPLASTWRVGASPRKSRSRRPTNNAPRRCSSGYSKSTPPSSVAPRPKAPRSTGAMRRRWSTPTCAAEATHRRERRP